MSAVACFHYFRLKTQNRRCVESVGKRVLFVCRFCLLLEPEAIVGFAEFWPAGVRIVFPVREYDSPAWLSSPCELRCEWCFFTAIIMIYYFDDETGLVINE
ncbi:unnamed protein product [Soboliphyme baturini]|uniref:Secreted protein n=1 Tax=Soboliphyme baturini TaxID=241478 RepID=A0A183IAC5_9BILA|nr:unnamed protein product [Soboliphyme baturini]